MDLRQPGFDLDVAELDVAELDVAQLAAEQSGSAAVARQRPDGRPKLLLLSCRVH